MDGLLHHPWIKRHTFDVAAYHRMAEAGILTERDRVELIEGELVAMAPIGPEHAGTTAHLANTFDPSLREHALLVFAHPLRLEDHSEPQPDAMLLRPRADFYRTAHPRPADVLLLIEIARTSRDYDRAVKLPLYGSHGIVEYWIVDLVDRCVQVCRRPSTDGYADIGVERGDAMIAPQAVPEWRQRVADLLG